MSKFCFCVQKKQKHVLVYGKHGCFGGTSQSPLTVMSQWSTYTGTTHGGGPDKRVVCVYPASSPVGASVFTAGVKEAGWVSSCMQTTRTPTNRGKDYSLVRLLMFMAREKENIPR